MIQNDIEKYQALIVLDILSEFKEKPFNKADIQIRQNTYIIPQSIHYNYDADVVRDLINNDKCSYFRIISEEFSLVWTKEDRTLKLEPIEENPF